MRKLALAVLAATFACGSAQAAVYTFTATSGQVASFTLTLAAPVTANRTFQKSEFDQAVGTFTKVDFCVRNTICPLGLTNTLYDEITVYNAVDPTPVLVPGPDGTFIPIPPAAVSVSYDFTPTAFTTTGNYTTVSAGAGFLQVAADVPEPASWVMMISGFGLVGTAMRRRELAVSFV